MGEPQPLHLLYLDDDDMDHRLMSAYLRLDSNHSYRLTACNTLEEAKSALDGAAYDALILDNRVPPFKTYHEPYAALKEQCGYSGPAIIVSADVHGQEFAPDQRRDHEVVLDKGDLLGLIKTGEFARLLGAPMAQDGLQP